MKTYLFTIRFKYFVDREDLVGLVKTTNIENFLNNYCKDMLDDIEGYEYQEVQELQKDEVALLCGTWSGSDFIKEELEDVLRG